MDQLGEQLLLLEPRDYDLPVTVPGSRRVRSVWMRPADSRAADLAIPSSAGRWVERSPGVFARVTVAIPVTVGAAFSLR